MQSPELNFRSYTTTSRRRNVVITGDNTQLSDRHHPDKEPEPESRDNYSLSREYRSRKSEQEYKRRKSELSSAGSA